MASRLVALKEGAIAAAGAADVGLIIALGRGKATDNPLARLRTSTQSTTAIRKYRPFPDGWAKESNRPADNSTGASISPGGFSRA